VKSSKSRLDRLSRAESEARSKLQAEVEGDEEGHDAVGASKAITDPNGPPRSTLFPPLWRILSLPDEVGPLVRWVDSGSPLREGLDDQLGGAGSVN